MNFKWLLEMTIESANENDFEEIENLFRLSFGADATMYPIPRAQNLLIAREGKQILGGGAFWGNPLHAKIPRLAITVKENFRNRGIGSSLHQALVRSVPLPLGVDGCCFDHDITALSFISKLGYSHYLDCFIPVVETSSVFPNFSVPTDIEVLSFSSARDRIERTAILDFLVDSYTQSHQWNPVTIEKDNPDWDEIAFWGIDEDMSLIALGGTDIKGVSTASLDEGVLQIRWAFAPAPEVTKEIGVLKALIGSQLMLAQINGIKTATFECDSTDPGMFQIGKDIKALSSEIWRRFRYVP